MEESKEENQNDVDKDSVLALLSDLGSFFLDHPVVDGNLVGDSNLLHFNFLKAF